MRLRAIGLLGLTLALGCSSMENPERTELSKRLETALPARATSDQVLAYLDAQKMEHSGYLHQEKSGNVILAAVRDKSRFNLIRTDFGISFQFDDQNRLKKYEIKPHYTGP